MTTDEIQRRLAIQQTILVALQQQYLRKQLKDYRREFAKRYTSLVLQFVGLVAAIVIAGNAAFSIYEAFI